MRLFSHILVIPVLMLCLLAGAGQALAENTSGTSVNPILQKQLDLAKKLQNQITKAKTACAGSLDGRDLKYCNDLKSDLNGTLSTAQVDLNITLTRSRLFDTDETRAQKEVNKVNQKIRDLASQLEQTRRVSGDLLSVSGQTRFPTAKSLLESIIDLLIKFIGLAALILLVFGGFRLIIAAGNDTEIQRAKDMIQYAVVGLIVALLSYIIVAAVQALLFR